MFKKGSGHVRVFLSVTEWSEKCSRLRRVSGRRLVWTGSLRQVSDRIAEGMRTGRGVTNSGSGPTLASVQHVARFDRGIVDSPNPNQTSTILGFGLWLARSKCTKGRMRKTPRAQKSETEASSNLFRKILDDLHEKVKRPVSQHQRARGRQ